MSHFIRKMPRVLRFLSLVRQTLFRCWMMLCWLCPIDKNKVVVVNYYGRGIGDNGKAIAEALLAKKPDLTVVWVATEAIKDSITEPYRYVRYRSLAYYREMATAGVWVDNSRKPSDIIKRKGQYYVQAWHGGVALKRIEKDAESSLSVGYVADAKHDSKMADLLLSSCSYFTEIFRNAFWYDGEILECGTPRLDVLFSDVDCLREKVNRVLGIGAGKKIALYVPTFRADGRMDCYDMDFQAVLDLLEEKTGDDWVFAIRLHPNVADRADVITYSDRLVNATAFPDLYELLPCVDLVISDYSSIMFEAGMLKKRVCLFATDVEDYAKDRNFYFNLRDLPFPLAESNAELLNILREFDEAAYTEALCAFNDTMGYFEDGHAAASVAEKIVEEMNYE